MTQIVRILRILRYRESAVRKRGRTSSSIPSLSERGGAAPRHVHGSSSTLVFRSICLASVPLLATSRRVAAGARWMSANGHTVLGQGCLGPITIARADTQQCAFLTSDSPWVASRVISLLSSTTRLSLPFVPHLVCPLYLSLGSPGPSPKPLPTNSGVRMGLCPFHDDRGGLLSPLSVTILSPVFPRS